MCGSRESSNEVELLELCLCGSRVSSREAELVLVLILNHPRMSMANHALIMMSQYYYRVSRLANESFFWKSRKLFIWKVTEVDGANLLKTRALGQIHDIINNLKIRPSCPSCLI